MDLTLLISLTPIGMGVAYFIFRLEHHISNDSKVDGKLDQILMNQQQGVTNAELRELIKEQTMILRELREGQIRQEERQ